MSETEVFLVKERIGPCPTCGVRVWDLDHAEYEFKKATTNPEWWPPGIDEREQERLNALQKLAPPKAEA